MEPELIISLIARIRRKANMLIIQELKNHNIMGIEPSHGDIIAALFSKTKLPMGELAQIIQRDKSTVTALVDKLVRLGYVKKSGSDIDNRVTYVTLTKKCKALWPVFENISEKLISTVYKGISNQGKEVLMELLTKVDNNL